jgi:hypothetical protein
MWRDFKNGDEQASGQRTFYFVLFEVTQIPQVANVRGYRVNGKTPVTTTVPVRDVTASMKAKLPRFDETLQAITGDPVVLQVTTEGEDPVAASIQLPTHFFGPKTYVLVCAVDQKGVYPNRAENKGMWITPEQLALAKEKRAKGVMVLFLSED